MMGFWRTLLRSIARNPISFFAVFCVMSTAGYLAFISDRLVDVLESPNWCGKALQAERMSNQNFGGLTACKDLLMIQVPILGTGLHIVLGGFVFCMVVLVVVVVAGAKASGKLPGGMEFNMGKDAAAAADHVVEGAEAAAEEVKQ
jgi:hypothetical protein